MALLSAILKRGCMRVSPSGGTGPSPILTKIYVVVGIDPKPSYEVLFWQVVSEIFEKNWSQSLIVGKSGKTLSSI